MLCPTNVTDFENNLILYFFSAMPQVLGTMLALIGAFYPTRAGTIRNEVRDLFNEIQKNVSEIVKIGGLKYYSNRAMNLLASNLQGEDKKVASLVYKMEDQELIFHDDLKTLDSSVYSENSLEEIKTIYSSFVFHFNQAVATFFTRSERLISKNSDLMSRYPILAIRPYFNIREIGEIISMMNNSKSKIELYNNIKQSIKDLFIFNGTILIFFILSFLLLKFSSDSICIHQTLLFTGVGLAAISAYSMIYFVYNSVSEKAQTSLFGFNIRINLKRVIPWIKGKWRKK
jgi:hypothetical protein